MTKKVRIATRKIKGEHRQVYVIRIGKKHFRVRLVHPRTKHFKGKGRKSGAGHFNYGRAHKVDARKFNRGEWWERIYRNGK